jgi:hypothetical protein
MARSIRTNNKDRWELISSIAEGVIATFKTKNEILAYIAEENVSMGKLKGIEEMMSFPSQWYVNDDYQWRDNKAYREWYDSVIMAPDAERFKLIDQKYDELMNEIKPMYKIFDYDKSPLDYNGPDGWEPHVIFETPLDLDIRLLIEIEGEIYATCMKSPKEKLIGVHKRTIEENPKEQNGTDFVCPYCKVADHDAFEHSLDEDKVECGYCYSEIEYFRHVEELDNGDIDIEYTVYPVKQKEIIKIK